MNCYIYCVEFQGLLAICKLLPNNKIWSRIGENIDGYTDDIIQQIGKPVISCLNCIPDYGTAARTSQTMKTIIKSTKCQYIIFSFIGILSYQSVYLQYSLYYHS